jgi:ectoine hydrolase
MKPARARSSRSPAAYRRYHCPLSRTVFLGKPPQDFLDAEKAVLEGMEAGLPRREGGQRLRGHRQRLLRRAGEARHRQGQPHRLPIGLSYPPDWGERTMSLRPGDKHRAEPGMTFHFMTGLWMDDWGFEITESIVITETGPEILADVPRKLFVKD